MDTTILPTDAKARKQIPILTGVLDYFPLAIAAIAHLSHVGNEQHNPGEPLHWAREKSTDHADCLGRHLLERGKIDKDGERHTTKAAWRILAMLQLELEKEGKRHFRDDSDFQWMWDGQKMFCRLGGREGPWTSSCFDSPAELLDGIDDIREVQV